MRTFDRQKHLAALGKAKRLSLVGEKFGRLTVLNFAGTRNSKTHWRCRCDCGTIVVVQGNKVRSGWTRSCGCWKNEAFGDRNRKHGQAGMTPEYRAWKNMRARCYNPSTTMYAYYGGRGIKVCARWDDFGCFLADMGPRPSPQHSLDRYPDLNGDYRPSNCRWATKKEQANNRRKRRVKNQLSEP